MGAAFNDQAEGAQALLLAGASVHAVDSAGWSSLHYAAANNNAAAVRVLCQHGASVETVNHAGQSAQDVARSCGNLLALAAMAPFADGIGGPRWARGYRSVPPAHWDGESFDECLQRQQKDVASRREALRHDVVDSIDAHLPT
jgi:hypothetical protein